MRTPTNSRLPLMFVGVLYLLLAATLIVTADGLPSRVASHFNGAGTADGWMTRANYLAFTLCLAILLPLFLVVGCFLFRYLPARAFNLPNRDYWLAPERRAGTDAHFFRYSLWFACLVILFVIGLHLTILKANSQFPPRLSSPLLFGCLGFFLTGMAIWILKMLWPFLKNPSDSASTEELRQVHGG